MKDKLKNIVNKLKNKGFTLVELLAVIIVLAIIALIGFSQVGKVIQTSKEKAAVESARNYIKAVNVEILNRESSGNPIPDGTYDIANFDIEVKGEKPNNGQITISNLKVSSASFILKGIGLEYTIESGVVVISTTTDQEMTSYSNGTVVYFNPTTNSKCNDYSSSNSYTENTVGCLKWYAYLETNDTVNLLLDHNVVSSDLTYWQVDLSLASSTSSWNSSLNIRMISTVEIGQIMNMSDVMTSTSIQDFKWLYDNNGKYWLSLSDGSCSSFAVYNSTIVYDECDNYKGANSWYGARPAITVNKSLLK